MRIAVAGATGRIGRLTTAALEAAGHQTVPLSRRTGLRRGRRDDARQDRYPVLLEQVPCLVLEQVHAGASSRSSRTSV